MSLINRMLRDLDARAATPGAPAFAQYLRPVGRRPVAVARGAQPAANDDHRAAWWRYAWTGMYLLVGMAFFLILGNVFRTPFATEVKVAPVTSPAPAVVAPVAKTEESETQTPAADLPPLEEPPVAADAAPVSASGSSPASASSSASASSPVSSPAPSVKPVPVRQERSAPVAVHSAPPKVAPRPAKAEATNATASDMRIDKQVNTTPRARAEAELARGMTLLNRGRTDGAIAAFKASLDADPGFVTARQTLIAVLAEQGRRGEAETIARDGLRLDPAGGNLAMIAARLALDRGDASEALRTLERSAGAGSANGDYRAFTGALYYRAGRYAEAAKEYNAALRISPQNATWWMGLGMAQEAASRREEAVAAFRQARASGTLGADLDAYVAERLRALQ